MAREWPVPQPRALAFWGDVGQVLTLLSSGSCGLGYWGISFCDGFHPFDGRLNVGKPPRVSDQDQQGGVG